MTTPIDSPRLVGTAERKRILDGAWAITFVALATMLVLPGRLGLDGPDPALALRVLFVYSVAYAAGSYLIDGMQPDARLEAALTTLHLSTVLFLAVVWLVLGGAAAPAFLGLMLLPVAASGALMRAWQPYLAAGLAVIAAWLVASLTSVELRWALFPSAGPLHELVEGVATLSRWQGASFSDRGVQLDAYELSAFSLLAFTVAATTNQVARMAERFGSRSATLSHEVEEATRLAMAIVRSAPDPVAVIELPSQRVFATSARFTADHGRPPPEVEAGVGEAEHGRGLALMDMVQFAEPARIRTLLGQSGKRDTAVIYADGPRTTRVRTELVEGSDRSFAFVQLEDTTEEAGMSAALDSLAEPVVVVGPDGDVVYANPAAREMFAGLTRGSAARLALEPEGTASGWWDPVPRLRHVRPVVIEQRPYTAHLTVSPVRGADARILVIRLEAR